MTTDTKGRKLVQTGSDGRTRTFRMSRDWNGLPWMSIEIRNRDGQIIEAADYTFTDEEFAQFGELIARA